MNVDLANNLYIESEKRRLELMDKKETERVFEVAFCGHFSAGKSTILNHLLGAEVLPTSPIPTSANIIGIKNGGLGLAVKRKDGTNHDWSGEIPWEQVREWGMNGADISEMTIFAPLSFMSDQSVIYDTPGVDSTDPTHQAVTMEALYTTDLIVYVMDYNHIQSETNLHFLKQLTEENKPLFIVINQIDKHDEKELPFAAFKQSVLDGLNEWGISPLELFFTSMKQTDHPLNEFESFNQKIKALLFNSTELINLSSRRLKESFYLSIVRRLELEKQEGALEVIENLEQAGYNKEDLNKKENIEQKLVSIEMAEEKIVEDFEEAWLKLTKDVTLFPYETTERAREYITSMDPSFKVGLFFSKKKTEEERQLRLQKLVESTQEKVKSQLEFHLHRFLEQMDMSNLSNREELEMVIRKAHVILKPEHFTEALKEGPHDRDYVFTFTKQLTQKVVKLVKIKADLVIEKYVEGLEEHLATERNQINEQLNTFKQIESFTQEIEQIHQNYDEMKELILNKANEYQDQGEFEETLTDLMQRTVHIHSEASTAFDQVILPSESVIDTDWDFNRTDNKKAQFNQEESSAWLAQLRSVICANPSPKAIENARERLLNRMDRYENQTFMISLFGAFSAGKSSFANALLGDHILPVSPHPTTATVTTVKSSTEENQHLTAKVEIKTKKQLDQEIRAVAKQLDVSLSFDSLPKWKPNEKQITTSWQKTYVTYLLTLKESMKRIDWELGSTVLIEHDELQKYVANEAYACLIHHVTIYYDCSLTNEGIVLVDTPGVNSIHGRHTNVAFTQLRESDAIFYVTYYNHAFSKSDQHFLSQLGKVNDQFTHDKLYFILNAADLASSKAELNGVRKHIYDQLTMIGLNEPRLYPLSSKKGLEAKLKGDSDDEMFTSFEKAFYTETIQELKQLSYKLIQSEARSYRNQIQETISMIYTEQSVRENKLKKRRELVDKWKEWVNDSSSSSAVRRTEQEVSELLLYLRDRVQYVLNDQFIQCINVTTVTGNTKKLQQQTFLAAIKEWRNKGNHFLSQELQATYIRIETSMQASLMKWKSELESSVRKELLNFSVDTEEIELPLQMDDYDQLIPIKPDNYLSYLSTLKNFFEEGGARALKEVLVSDGQEVARTSLIEIEHEIVKQTEQLLHSVEGQIKKSMFESLELEYERLTVTMTEEERKVIEEQYKCLEDIL